MTTRSSGFTLIELLVVVAILGILSAVGTIAYTGYLSMAKRNASENLMQQISLAQSEYYALTGTYLITGDASSCSATDASDDEIEEDLFDGDDIIPDGLGFNICTFGSGATFTVVADDGADCQLMLRRNSSLDETQCQ